MGEGKEWEWEGSGVRWDVTFNTEVSIALKASGKQVYKFRQATPLMRRDTSTT